MWVRVASAIVLLLLPTSVIAQTEKRIALLIGNKDYKAGVGALTNPLNDIRIVGDALRSVGFEVLKPIENAQRSVMLVAIHAFAAKLKAAGPEAVGFLYYSGHGIASAGENYLIPTDVDEPSTVQLSVQGVKQSEVLAILRGEAPNAAHYFVLDACRNTLQGARGGKGFVPVGQQSGVLVAFASEPGKTATDIGQGSGPYAAALATELMKPGQTDLIMFHNVRVAVMDKTKGDQVPWTEDGIQRRQRIIFGAEGKVPLPPMERSPEHPFDGVWYVERHSSNCGKYNKVSATLAIKEGIIVSALGAGGVQGSVTTSGTLNLTHKSIAGGVQRYSGRLQGNRGSGTFAHSTSPCKGTFTLARQ
jgi:Caspase domain